MLSQYKPLLLATLILYSCGTSQQKHYQQEAYTDSLRQSATEATHRTKEQTNTYEDELIEISETYLPALDSGLPPIYHQRIRRQLYLRAQTKQDCTSLRHDTLQIVQHQRAQTQEKKHSHSGKNIPLWLIPIGLVGLLGYKYLRGSKH